MTTALGELKAEGHIVIISNRFFIPSIPSLEKLAEANKNDHQLEKQTGEVF